MIVRQSAEIMSIEPDFPNIFHLVCSGGQVAQYKELTGATK